MKQILLILIILVAPQVSRAERNRKFDPEAYRIEMRNYIIAKASLSADEAQKFFTLFDEMRAKERALFRKTRINKNKPPKTDEECRKAILQKDNTEIELKKMQLKYHESMLKVLPPSVVLKCLFYAEEFDRNKLREASQRHGGYRKGHDSRNNNPKTNNRR